MNSDEEDALVAGHGGFAGVSALTDLFLTRALGSSFPFYLLTANVGSGSETQLVSVPSCRLVDQTSVGMLMKGIRIDHNRP
jgi:hypothetical protein